MLGFVSRNWILATAATLVACIVLQNWDLFISEVSRAAASYPVAAILLTNVAILLVLFMALNSLCGCMLGDSGGMLGTDVYNYDGGYFFSHPPPEPGAVGLSNLGEFRTLDLLPLSLNNNGDPVGNTCYLSCSLVCLSSCAPATIYFLSGEFEDHVNQLNTSGTRGQVARAYAQLLGGMWFGGRSSVSPSRFKVGECRWCHCAGGH